jgi:kynurenine formamidase
MKAAMRHARSLLLVVVFLCSQLAADDSPTLRQIASGQARIVDLTYTLNERSPYWPGDKYQPFELKTIATLDEDGVLSKLLILPEHLGTHIDAPNHFEPDRPAVDQIPPEDLFAPGVVIDIALQAEQDADYAVSLADVARWESEHGRIPDKAVVLVHTGWGRFWTNYDRYKNQDVHGTLHFPGVSKEAAEFLVTERDIRGMGIDTLSIDPGTSKGFAVHHVLNKARRYALENVASLDQLPARGFELIIAPIKVEHGTGGPTRIFAVMAKPKP